MKHSERLGVSRSGHPTKGVKVQSQKRLCWDVFAYPFIFDGFIASYSLGGDVVGQGWSSASPASTLGFVCRYGHWAGRTWSELLAGAEHLKIPDVGSECAWAVHLHMTPGEGTTVTKCGSTRGQPLQCCRKDRRPRSREGLQRAPGHVAWSHLEGPLPHRRSIKWREKLHLGFRAESAGVAFRKCGGAGTLVY